MQVQLRSSSSWWCCGDNEYLCVFMCSGVLAWSGLQVWSALRAAHGTPQRTAGANWWRPRPPPSCWPKLGRTPTGNSYFHFGGGRDGPPPNEMWAFLNHMGFFAGSCKFVMPYLLDYKSSKKRNKKHICVTLENELHFLEESKSAKYASNWCLLLLAFLVVGTQHITKNSRIHSTSCWRKLYHVVILHTHLNNCLTHLKSIRLFF